ncbi:LCP family protein [Candidatus Saganbacteria bacterium]|nr:LCP family protein [Candidatus Saganbacteria bacterium]
MRNNWESDYIKKIYGQKYSGPKYKIPFNGIFISFIILLITFSAFFGFTLAVISKFMLFETLLTLIPGDKFLGETNVVILGVDGEGPVKRSDSVMVAHINPATNTVGLVSIPRDTRVEIAGRGEDKINHAFAFGGPDLSRKTAENFLGVKIPYYIVINFAGVRNLINEIGGIEINVEKRMYYVDNSQGLFVDLYPGRQRLDGKNALAYMRYRTDGGDLNRILRQQKFIKALASQITNKENVLRSPGILLRLFSYMDSNLDTKQILGLALNMRRIYDYGQIKMSLLQGYDEIIDGVYYMRPDPRKIKEAVTGYLTDRVSLEK